MKVTRVILRYVVAFLVITYGFAKLNGSQFTILDSELDKPMGQQRVLVDVVLLRVLEGLRIMSPLVEVSTVRGSGWVESAIEIS